MEGVIHSEVESMPEPDFSIVFANGEDEVVDSDLLTSKLSGGEDDVTIEEERNRLEAENRALKEKILKLQEGKE